MSEATDPSIVIEVSGGLVQNVYTSLPRDIKVIILDFDTEKDDDEQVENETLLKKAIQEMRQIY